MRIIVCAKEVLDPDAVNNYALEGRLTIGDDGRTITQSAIPHLMNAYDEQAIEAALRIRDAGVECTITVVSVGENPSAILKHAAALGADEIAHIKIDDGETDCAGTAALLAAYIRSTGGANLILCGRQASDDDQGVVPALLGERLEAPVITVARDLALSGRAVRVTRVTPDGDEIVEADMPAVVTISNELGAPRYPTAARSMQARRMAPTVVTPAGLGLTEDATAPRVTLEKLFVPSVQGNCEFINGTSPAESARTLIARLREERLLA
jgi:electron transfer flavoprotein beta subunit